MRSEKIKRIISSIVFIALLTVAISTCANVLEPKDARIKYTPFYESDTNFDVIFLGTSHMWNHVLPMEMWSDYGISSYNWGYANCTPAENYYLIQDILKYTSPKVVVIDVYGLVEYEGYGNGKYRTDRIEQQHVQFDSLPIWSINKINAAKDVFDDYENNEDFVWNFIMYHNRWRELGKSDFEYDITTEKGATFLTGLGTGYFLPIAEDEKTEINSVCYSYFLDIIEYCETQGVQVLCTYLPYGSVGANQQKIANTIGEIVEQYPNCTYKNMINENILNLYTDVCSDKVHLNYSGALKVTTWLGQYLRENYLLDDYSTDPSWQKDYLMYNEYKENVLKMQTTLATYLVQLSDDDFIVEAEVYDGALTNDERLVALFDNAGIVPIFVEQETNTCAKLVVKNTYSGEIIDTIYFHYDAGEKFDFLSINKVSVSESVKLFL